MLQKSKTGTKSKNKAHFSRKLWKKKMLKKIIKPLSQNFLVKKEKQPKKCSKDPNKLLYGEIRKMFS